MKMGEGMREEKREYNEKNNNAFGGVIGAFFYSDLFLNFVYFFFPLSLVGISILFAFFFCFLVARRTQNRVGITDRQT